MGIFDKKDQYTRSELRALLRKASGKIPGSNSFFNRNQRVALEKEFGKEYGSYITKEDAKRLLRDLRKQKSKTSNLSQRVKIDRKIRYLKEFFGINRF